jgi:hypothetical protein
MSRKIFMDAFYGQFSDFLDQLAKVFPEDSDFPTFKTGLHLFQKTNPKIVPEQIVIHVLPFEQTIRSRDEKFFMDHGFDTYASDDALGAVIMKMKSLWSTLSDNSKKVVWDYTTLLMDLAKRCVEQ